MSEEIKQKASWEEEFERQLENNENYFYWSSFRENIPRVKDFISDLLKKRDEAIIEECGKVAWAGDDGFYVKFSDIKTIIATLNTK